MGIRLGREKVANELTRLVGCAILQEIREDCHMEQVAVDVGKFGPPTEKDRGEWRIKVLRDLSTQRLVAQAEIKGIPQLTGATHVLVMEFQNVNAEFCERLIALIDQRKYKKRIPIKELRERNLVVVK